LDAPTHVNGLRGPGRGQRNDRLPHSAAGCTTVVSVPDRDMARILGPCRRFLDAPTAVFGARREGRLVDGAVGRVDARLRAVRVAVARAGRGSTASARPPVGGAARPVIIVLGGDTMVVVLRLRSLTPLPPRSRRVRLGLSHPTLSFELVDFPDALSSGAAVPGGVALQRAPHTVRVIYRPAAAGHWLVLTVEAARRGGALLALPAAPRLVPDTTPGILRRPPVLTFAPAPTVATLRDASGEGFFAAYVAEIPPSGLLVVATGDFGHGRDLWVVTPDGAQWEDYGSWLAAHAPVEELTPSS